MASQARSPKCPVTPPLAPHIKRLQKITNKLQEHDLINSGTNSHKIQGQNLTNSRDPAL